MYMLVEIHNPLNLGYFISIDSIVLLEVSFDQRAFGGPVRWGSIGMDVSPVSFITIASGVKLLKHVQERNTAKTETQLYVETHPLVIWMGKNCCGQVEIYGGRVKK